LEQHRDNGDAVKPSPKRDFPVNVSAEQDERSAPIAAFYRGVYDVQLNHVVSIHVVPKFTREPWPPCVASDHVTSELEARRSIVAAAYYSIAPDDERANQIETFTDEDAEKHFVLFISESVHAELDAELERLAAASRGVHDATPRSQLGAPVLQQLLQQVVSSGVLSTYVMTLLGH
jgi:hypothetical protein